MSDNPQPKQNQQQQRPSPERTPIRIERLMFQSEGNGSSIGMRLPDGTEGKGEKITPHLEAGIRGSTKIDIEHRPWMRVFRVTKSRRVTRTEKDRNGKDIEVESWIPMGPPYHVPDTWCVSVPADE
jgi:hypothetical protein